MDNQFEEMKKICLQKKDLDQKRLNFELEKIEKFGLVESFYRFCIEKKQGEENKVNSLVAYALGITSKYPEGEFQPHKKFESGRVGLPDIDLDFTDRRRNEVINYVAEKYGKDHVAQIITFGTMAARAAIRDVGRALMIPYSYCDRVAKMIPFGMSLEETLKKVHEFKELYESDSQAKNLIDLGKKLEGVARHASTHACGIVISEKPLTDYVPLQHPTQNDDTIITQYEMHAIEDLGLLKMDLLGLKNLTIIEDCLTRIYSIHNKSMSIDDIPLDDDKVYKLLRDANSVGVFQLECLSGETIISNTTIKKLFKTDNKKTLSSVYLDEGKVHKNKIIDILEGGEKNLYTLIAENNWYIKASEDHYFLTENGWKKLRNIKPGEGVLMKNKAKHLVYNTCRTCGKQIDGQKEGKSQFCYKCSASFYKNPSKKESKRKISESRIKFYREGGKPWNYGATVENNKTWKETAEKISKALLGRPLEERWGGKRANEFKKSQSKRSRGNNNPMFGKSCPHRKGGFREDLGHYVRSAWEADFARILKLHNLNYEYEPKTFQLTKPNGEIMHYTPDFYVPSQNTFYEIKGWFHDLDKEKVELFQKQYLDYKFILISATKFAEFALKYKTLINWECPKIPTKQGFGFIKVKEIKYSGREKTYDVKMQSPGNNFVANGFVVHNSSGMQAYLKQLKPTSFEDIVAMVALYRPGPMQFIPDFIKGKHGKKKIEYLHPKLEPILKNTYGVCIFQEQLMQIAQQLAGFSLSEADVLRKAIGKKIKELLHAQKEKFISGCIKNNIDKKIGQELWQWILPFAEYGFNRAHATAYATIACQTAYLKTHYPVEFMAALLTSEKADIERIAVLIKECKKMGIHVLPPDVNESFRNFSVVPNENKIRFGLLAIKNVGENIVEAIITERKNDGPFKSMHDFVSRIQSKTLNKKSLESLIKSGVFDKLEERNTLLHNLEDILEANREIKQNLNNGQKSLFENCSSFNHSVLRLKTAQSISLSEQLNWEKELLGLYVSSHPLESYKSVFDGKVFPLNNLTDEMVGKLVKIGGIISTIKRILTRTGKPMLFLSLEDLTNKIEVVVFPTVIEKNPAVFQENKIVFVKGKVDNRDGEVKILADEVEEILES
ncbi:DNA polymerase III subunit alpha [Patescibacteria group bacterium]|nr:DNA polymerase III subunit alpha [Patescibacteria group bacterium]MBU4367744.1 DNA polymerase III subunit alpha [Patescibacteria group bacterium]MBU4461806.1 DNA polymerase III subunit alpha [Patescibacteria group bacterium]MCG2700063.1 DNA polymerase III subunit alpha [Candidatus Parcubacteria bacterium]